MDNSTLLILLIIAVIFGIWIYKSGWLTKITSSAGNVNTPYYPSQYYTAQPSNVRF